MKRRSRAVCLALTFTSLALTLLALAFPAPTFAQRPDGPTDLGDAITVAADDCVKVQSLVATYGRWQRQNQRHRIAEHMARYGVAEALRWQPSSRQLDLTFVAEIERDHGLAARLESRRTELQRRIHPSQSAASEQMVVDLDQRWELDRQDRSGEEIGAWLLTLQESGTDVRSFLNNVLSSPYRTTVIAYTGDHVPDPERSAAECEHFKTALIRVMGELPWDEDQGDRQ